MHGRFRKLVVMSESNDSNAGSWVIIIAIAAVLLYFWKEVLMFIGELILGILTLANNIIQEIIMIALFIGAIYLIVKMFEMFKK